MCSIDSIAELNLHMYYQWNLHLDSVEHYLHKGKDCHKDSIHSDKDTTAVGTSLCYLEKR